MFWTASSEFGSYRLCEQRRFRRACASAQSRQNLRCSLIQAVSQEEPSDRKADLWPLWMAVHAQLKFVMTEFSKTQIRLTRPFLYICMYVVNTVFYIINVALPLTQCIGYNCAIKYSSSLAWALIRRFISGTKWIILYHVSGLRVLQVFVMNKRADGFSPRIHTVKVFVV